MRLLSPFLYGFLVLSYFLFKEEEDIGRALFMYLPFMVLFPSLVYPYGLMILLVLLPIGASYWAKGREKIAIYLAIGIGLSQIHAVAYEKILGSLLPPFIPGFGALRIVLTLLFS